MKALDGKEQNDGISVLRENFIDIIILLLIILFLFYYFKPSLILSKTITAGGDTASHYYTAYYLKNYLIPDSKITGWTMGNYAGFPILQYYFPIPFLIMAFLSYFIPLQIAFKIVTVLGIFMLPISIFIMLKLLNFKNPIPIIGGIFSLPFLFNEGNSMWGGNIPSTLAGEFSHSLSLALSIVFFGALYHWATKKIKNKKFLIANSILFSFIALSHIYTTFIAALSSFFLLLGNFKKRFLNMAVMYSISLLLISWWILPFLLNIDYTTPYNIRWSFESFFEVVPVILIPFFILAVAGIICLILFYRDESESESETKIKIQYLLSPLILSLFLFFIANYIGLVDVRFLINIYLWSVILAAIGFNYFIQLTKKIFRRIKFFSKSIPFITLILTILFIKLNVSYIPNWIKWNYEGFESKQAWPAYNEINEFLKGGINDARVVYEHSPLHNDFGTERAFESLPLFSGRSTLEGVYMQSSISSPFIFYIQSEISEKHSCPFWNRYPCTSFNLERGTQHLKMFNVRHFIARTEKVKSALESSSEYKLKKKFKDYDIYELKNNENRYVVPLEYEPVLIELKKFSDWKKMSYEWFVDGDLDIHLAFARKIDGTDKGNFKIARNQKNFAKQNFFAPDKIKVGHCDTNEEIFNDEIKIKTDCINKPLLIKVSYHPNWKVEGADRIYLISPSFMLIRPRENNVRLYY